MSGYIESYGWKIYLRDLNEELQKTEIAAIKESRPDLFAAISEGEDILIGYSMRIKDYEVV